jgi:biotin-(acetyl-CoA carboxylase) ligase
MAASGVPLAMLPDLRTLAGEIGEALRLQFQECSVDASAGIRRWRRFDATSGRRYLFDEGGAERSGVAEGIDNSGALLLRDEAETLTAVMSASSLREAPDR